jgi:pimeloyl-ACP methyl ester carboxylesterase
MSATGTLELDGCRLQYTTRGTGPPILFVQGVGVHGDGWLPQVERLAGDHACVFFDHRGLGRSQPRGAPISVERLAADALAILDAERIDAAHVVGHSLGGLVALQLAAAARARVSSLALLCTFADGSKAGRGGRVLLLGLRTRIGTARMRARAFLQLVLPPAALARADLGPLVRSLQPLFGHDLAHQPPVAMAQLRAMRACDLTARLRELAGIPTLVVSAAHDLIAPPALGRALAAGIPGARFVELPDAAHGATVTHADATTALLRAHLGACSHAG